MQCDNTKNQLFIIIFSESHNQTLILNCRGGENCPNSDNFDNTPILGLKKHSKYSGILFNIHTEIDVYYFNNTKSPT